MGGVCSVYSCGRHSTIKRMKSQSPPIISLTPFVRLYHEKLFCESLSMSPRQFRAWLRCLGCPAIELKGGRYIEHTTFSLLLLASLHVSPPLHPTPGSASRSSRPVPPPPILTRDLTAIIISQLMLGTQASEKLSRSTILREAKKAATHLALLGYNPTDNRNRRAALARRRTTRDPVIRSLLEALNDTSPSDSPPA